MKKEKAVKSLYHITRKIPPRAENTFIKPKKERDYRNFRQSLVMGPEQALLKKMVNQEIDAE